MNIHKVSNLIFKKKGFDLIVVILYVEFFFLNNFYLDMMRYLGGINGGYAILAFLRFLPLAISLFNVNDDQRINLKIKEDHQITVTADLLCFTALGLANISQAILNFFYAKPSGRWIVGHWRGLKTDRITILDSLFTVLDFSIVGARLAGF